MSIDLTELRTIFFEEAADHVRAMETALLTLERTPSDPELIASIFRGIHSIKGASNVVEVAELAEFSHLFESMLARVREGALAMDPEIVDLSLRSVDVVAALLRVAAGTSSIPDAFASVKAELEAQLATSTRSRASVRAPRRADAAVTWTIRFSPAPGSLAIGLDPLLALRSLSEIGEVVHLETDTSRLPSLDAFDPELAYLSWKITLTSSLPQEAIADVFSFFDGTLEVSAAVQDLAPADIPSLPIPSQSESAATIRVSTEKIDKLIDLVGELLIANSTVTEIIGRFTPSQLPTLEAAVQEMQRHTRELQERVMGVRMLPMSRVFDRFPRLVRDLARTLDRIVELEIVGADTEVDKAVIEHLADPLLHLVRNSIDHGIEQAAARVALDKRPAGALRLSASHVSGRVVVEVEDDGAGIDLERVRQRGVDQGLVSAADSLDSDAIHELLFVPGFSTAPVTTEVSGRGVGLDVVRRNVEALGGTIAVSSQLGIGTLFRIELPLTLSIIEGLFVRVGSETYVLPLGAVVESFCIGSSVGAETWGRGQLVSLRGEALPVVRLHELFGIRREPDAIDKLFVVVDDRGHKIALLVDELVGQSQIVLKSVDRAMRSVDGISGATILGNGRVALVIDAAALTRFAASIALPTSLALSA